MQPNPYPVNCMQFTGYNRNGSLFWKKHTGMNNNHKFSITDPKNGSISLFMYNLLAIPYKKGSASARGHFFMKKW